MNREEEQQAQSQQEEVVEPLSGHDNEEDRDRDEEPTTQPPSRWQRLCQFYTAYEFLILVTIVILLARAYPKLGAVYLAPHITATWIAVVFIFIMAGLGLKTEEFKKAFLNIYFNIFVQIFNFGFVSSVIYGVSRGLAEMNILSQDLADGMVICASLPMTINMVLVLTKSSNGDEAAAIFNAAFGNMVGVFLSPILILGYLGVTGNVDLFQVFYKLALRVVVPVAIGQVLQKTSKLVVDFVKQHKARFKRIQQYCLVFIVYTVFCRTFQDDTESSILDIFLMILFQLLLLSLLMIVSWMILKVLFPKQPKLRVMGLFGCTHKTVAMGVPLINAIYEDNPSIGLYTLPLLIWHPMQLVLGTLLAPKLSRWVESEEQRISSSTPEEGKPQEADSVRATGKAIVDAEEGRISAVIDDCDEAPSNNNV